MKIRITLLTLGIVAFGLTSACGDENEVCDAYGNCWDAGSNGSLSGTGSFDNVASCEQWANSVSCAGNDISQYLDCSAYANTACDISDYFTCLDNNTQCTSMYGTTMLDTAGWSNCYSLANCN